MSGGVQDPHPKIGLAMQRLTTKEVCDLARLSPATVWRRVRRGELPKPIDYGRQALFDRSAVEQALGWHPHVNGSVLPAAAKPRAATWSPDRWRNPK